MKFEPNYYHILSALQNKRPDRLPLYEHHIDTPFIAKVIGENISADGLTPNELVEFYRKIVGFWQEMTYDAFSYEAAICEILPGHGAILGGMLGPIQTREDFEKYPFEDIPRIFWEKYTPHLEAIRKVIPMGMKAYGGCGYGIFETSEDLVGYENLAVLQYLDPDLFKDLYLRIGDLYIEIWTEMIKRYDDIFVFYRMGDDLGFKTGTLLEPDTIREHVFPQYKRLINTIHASGKKFLLHSCGNIFELMDDIINLGIDAKHSNEDEIAPFEKWIELYGKRIALMGGIDVNTLCLNSYDEVYNIVKSKAVKYRNSANGYCLGSGNSIAEYVPVDGYMAMIEAAKSVRKLEE